MEKYTRIAIEVEAIQWYPRKEIPVAGFKNVLIKFVDSMGQPRETVDEGEIVQMIGDKEYKLMLKPGDWVLLIPNGGLMVVNDKDFAASYLQSSQLQQVKEHGSPEQKALFGIPVPIDPEK